MLQWRTNFISCIFPPTFRLLIIKKNYKHKMGVFPLSLYLRSGRYDPHQLRKMCLTYLKQKEKQIRIHFIA